ncbi:uncharacterized protein LOC124811550 [Hydra vulgaris]|uniref:uncharacterized protein LOC124811550 n=1 Tax=Hydra vulgaris TaxID=6087 RepID=UPI0032EA50BB
MTLCDNDVNVTYLSNNDTSVKRTQKFDDSEVSDSGKSCIIENSEGFEIIECLKNLKPIKAIMGIFKELGDSEIYDYSLQETLVDCLSDETVYVYLSLLASNQDKNKIEVLAPAGLLSQEVLPNKTALIQRKNLDELLKLDILICCVVAKHHWTLTIIKPKEKSFYLHQSSWRNLIFNKKRRNKME